LEIVHLQIVVNERKGTSKTINWMWQK